MDKCQCSLSIRLTGDGCRHCQPQTYIENLELTLEGYQRDIERLEQQWQPIDTAPTLQDVLVFNYASEDAIVAVFDGENWHTGWEPLLRDAGKLMKLIPTHWMPLPKPPEAE